MRRMVEAAAGIKTDVSVLLTDAGKRGQECFCRGGIRYLLRMLICKNDGISILTVFLNRVRVLQARKKPALKLTGFKSAVPALAHPAAVAAAEAFIGFCDLLELIACKQQPAKRLCSWIRRGTAVDFLWIFKSNRISGISITGICDRNCRFQV